MLRSVVSNLSFRGLMRTQAHAYLPREREAWNTDLEKRNVARADLPRDIGHDA